jgi:hypothetical protein
MRVWMEGRRGQVRACALADRISVWGRVIEESEG